MKVKVLPGKAGVKNVTRLLHVVAPFTVSSNDDVAAIADTVIPRQVRLAAQRFSFDIAVHIYSGKIANNQLQRKSRELTVALSGIDELRGRTYPSAMIGLSLGGVIARHALVTIENTGYQHGVEYYISYDSPHLGSHIPLSLQRIPKFMESAFRRAKDDNSGGFINNFFSLLNDIGVLDEFDEGVAGAGDASQAAGMIFKSTFGTDVARESLIQNVDANNSRHPNSRSLVQTLKSLGLPKKTLSNIAIANGSGNGRKLIFNDTRYFDYDSRKTDKLLLQMTANIVGTQPRVATRRCLKYKTVSYAGRICAKWAYTYKNEHQVFGGHLRYPDASDELLGDGEDSYRASYDIANQQVIDTAPCSTSDIPLVIEEQLRPSLLDKWKSPRKDFIAQSNYSCFIPTLSALAIDAVPLDSSGKDYTHLSPFSEVITNSYNNEHLSVFPEALTRLNQVFHDTYVAFSSWRYVNQPIVPVSGRGCYKQSYVRYWDSSCQAPVAPQSPPQPTATPEPRPTSPAPRMCITYGGYQHPC